MHEPSLIYSGLQPGNLEATQARSPIQGWQLLWNRGVRSPLTLCVAGGKLLCLSEPQGPHLQDGGSRTCFLGVSGEVSGILHGSSGSGLACGRAQQYQPLSSSSSLMVDSTEKLLGWVQPSTQAHHHQGGGSDSSGAAESEHTGRRSSWGEHSGRVRPQCSQHLGRDGCSQRGWPARTLKSLGRRLVQHAEGKPPGLVGTAWSWLCLRQEQRGGSGRSCQALGAADALHH